MIDQAISKILKDLAIPSDAVEPRSKNIVKIDPARVKDDRNGKVVLVTAMTPTPAGEGKTTTTIGLVDALNLAGVRAVGALREPSLGPLFGRKGGAIGGGKAKVTPEDSINLHFTGDIHAVTSANNLLSALVDNHMYFSREPKLDPENITWGRVIDMNDRALRKIECGRATKRGPLREERFDITAASEVMAILCRSLDPDDLKKNLAEITVGLDENGKRVTAGDLNAQGAMSAILLDACRPNLVRTLEGSPVFVHGGPFANIAQGTSTLMQTKLCKQLADVVITEAGFAFDLGGFKFLDIKCRQGGFLPHAVVLVVTVRAIRHHGGVDFNAGANVAGVKAGLENVGAHLDAMKRLGLPDPVVSVNLFGDESEEELALVRAYVEARGASCALGSYFADGGKGAADLATAVMNRLEGQPSYTPPYADSDDAETKLDKLCKVVLGADGAVFNDAAKADLARIDKMGLAHLPVCLAKTHLSISDDKTALCRPTGFTVTITGLRPSSGAGFLVALCGPVLTMPGLPKAPASAGVDVVKTDAGYDIVGLR